MSNNKILTLVDDTISPFCEELMDNQIEYAETKRFEHEIATKSHWPDQHPCFGKVWMIHKALQAGSPFVIWADADVAFTDMTYDFTKLVADKKQFIAVYQQSNWKSWPYPCCGLMILRNCEELRSFVKEWIRRIETWFMKDHPWEQWYFTELVRECDYKGIKMCTAKEIGCFAPECWTDGTPWRRGYPSIHFGGPAEWPRRRRVFLDYYEPIIKR